MGKVTTWYVWGSKKNVWRLGGSIWCTGRDAGINVGCVCLLQDREMGSTETRLECGVDIYTLWYGMGGQLKPAP
jgi:hypothetical protein